ncbi:MAG: hypothetical protein H6741_13275 [Alphaproteobacteria bacterium]|nr:hypothetical protein [Alphaproteobacteria bacterium]
MDLSTGILLGAATLLALNRFIHVGERWHRRTALFWTLQLGNLLGACFMVLRGIPDFHEGPLQMVNLFIAGLMVLHIVLNNRAYVAAWHEERKGLSAEQQARRDAMLEKLRAGED